MNKWSESENAKAESLAVEVIKGVLSYYQASRRLQSCTNRSTEACRQRLKLSVRKINNTLEKSHA